MAVRRQRAAALSATLELPQFKGRAGWEFTDISGLDLAAYRPAGAPQNGEAAVAPTPLFTLDPVAELRQIDGGEATFSGELPEGVIVSSMERAAADHGELLSRHLDSVVNAKDVFAARADAAAGGGAFVYVPAGVAIERPILLTAIQAQSGTELGRRVLVVLEPGSQAEVWEQTLSGAADTDGVVDTVFELALGENSHLRFVSGQELSERSWIFGTHRAEVSRDASLEWVALGFGSAGGHVRMETRLGGPGADARVTGAYACHGRQHIDFDTTQEHAAPSTTSDLAFRGVLQGRSTAVWKGNIIVDPGAQKTDAFQESRNLLISKRAHADAIPGLEIQANDVRCTHAAAIAQVDPEQLFYLRSHGLPEPAAKRLVIEGFLSALVERFPAGPVREVLGDALDRRLSLILGD
jgi:Fe-S cluster assembly protein SufD